MSWYPAASVKSALHQADLLWPDRSHASDGTIGDASHSASVSDHNPDSKGCVHAYDMTHDPAHGVDTFKLANDLRDRCLADATFRGVIKYIISNRRIYNPTISPAWRPYNGSSPHRDHVHVSINYTNFAENWPGQWWQPIEEDWFDMATKKDLEDAINTALQPVKAVLGPLYNPGEDGSITKALYVRGADGKYREEIHVVAGLLAEQNALLKEIKAKLD